MSWRLLLWLWGVVLVGSASAAGVLTYLGPPQSAPILAAGPPASLATPSGAPDAQHSAAGAADPASKTPDVLLPAKAATTALAGAAPTAIGPTGIRPPGAAIPPPDTALLEPASYNFPAQLPRIAADKRTPMDAYAAGFDPTDTRPRIAILLGGIGQSTSDSDEALRALPPAVSFAVSPYMATADRLLSDIRTSGHEMLISLPMEPQGYPVNDEGNQSLLIGASADQNAMRLDWTLSRLGGYVGATNALDGLRGERFSASSTQIETVLQKLAARGLLYIDAAPEMSRIPFADIPGLFARRVDLTVDAPAVRAEIDWKLAQLEDLARDHGAALGLASLPRPVTVARIAAWAASLGQRGFALAPVSVIVRTPLTQTPQQMTKTNLAR